jgi:hypothetical protein
MIEGRPPRRAPLLYEADEWMCSRAFSVVEPAQAGAMLNDRPNGVIGISAVCVVLAAISILYALLLGSGRIPLSDAAWLLGGGLEQRGPIALVLYSALLIGLAIGLWKRRRSAARATILTAIAGIALAVPAMSSAVADARLFAIAREGLQIMVRVLVVFYLSQEPVKEWFANR